MAYPTDKPWDLDVRNWGAKGDGTMDDTASIQAALDEAESYGGGIVFFPPGTYLISATLKLPSKVYIKGVAGTTYNKIGTDPSGFLARVNTVIKLNSNAMSSISMVEPKIPNDFSSAGIENIILDGNKDNQNGSDHYGIKIVDASSGQRSQTVIKNVIIYRVKGIGFYGGVNQHELFLDWVTAFSCFSHGFVLRGEDIKGTRIASGVNSGVGIKFPGSSSATIPSGSGRFFDIDSWENLIGMEISDTLGYTFFYLQLSRNSRGGLHIYSTTPQPPGFSPGNIRIYGGVFFQNSQNQDNGYSDIKLEPNTFGYSPYDIELLGCQFHGSATTPKPKYVIESTSIEDTSLVAHIRRCIIIAGFIKRSNYATGVSDTPQAIKDCFNYDTGELLNEHELNYSYINSNITSTYNLSLGDAYLLVNAFTNNAIVNLPTLSSMTTGRVFYIVKQDGVAGHTVTIQAAIGETINGNASVILSGSPAYQAYMIIHGGTGWVGVKIA